MEIRGLEAALVFIIRGEAEVPSGFLEFQEVLSGF
jgi:hypothetical protein